MAGGGKLYYYLPRTMNSIRRFTACLEMHPSLAPGQRSWAPTEEMAMM